MFNNDWNVAKNKSGRVMLDKCFAIKDYVEALSILCHVKPGQARPYHSLEFFENNKSTEFGSTSS